MNVNNIEDGEVGLSVRSKLNRVIDQAKITVINTISNFSVLQVSEGELVLTKGYSSVGDTLHGKYIIKSGAGDGFGSFSTGTPDLYAELVPENNIILSGQYGITSEGVQALVNRMNSEGITISLSSDILATNIKSEGYTSIVGNGFYWKQNNESGRGLYIELKGTNLGAYSSVVNEALSGSGISVTRVNGIFSVEVGDIVRVVDSVTIGGNINTRHAELAQVKTVNADHILLDCVLRHFNYYTNGNVFLLNKSSVDIKGVNFTANDPSSTNVNRIASLTVAGAINPSIDVSVIDDYTTGVAMRGCYSPDVNVTTSNLRDDAANGALGYAIVCYGSCKGASVKSLATKVLTAYDDGIWANADLTMDFDSGVSLDSVVTGIGRNTSGATWDTHPYSDGTTFFNTKAFEGSLNDQNNTSNSYAYKIRGTNVTIVNGHTNRRFSLSVGDTLTYLIESVNNIQLIEPPRGASHDTTNVISISYEPNASIFPLQVNINDSYLNGAWFSSSTGLLNYLNFYRTTFDMKGTKPSQSTTKNYVITLRDCIFKNAGSVRVQNGMALTIINTSLLMYDNSPPITISEGGKIVLINSGYSSSTSSTSFISGSGTITSATLIKHAGNYRYDSNSDAFLLTKTIGAASVISAVA